MIKYEKGIRYADAIYTDNNSDKYNGNPLLQSLPEIENKKEIKNFLENEFVYEKDKYNKQEIDEIFKIVIFYIFTVLPVHINLAQKINDLIKKGYVGRNPLCDYFEDSNYSLANCAQNKDINFDSYNYITSTASGLCLVGHRGMGKTSTINNIMSMYPQAIIHKKYNGNDFNYLQLVWMKIECPFDGSIKGFCINFFIAFDELTHDVTYAKYANYNATVDSMLCHMAIIVHRHNLGVLIIDEIQNMNVARGKIKEKMFNFLNNLIKKIGIPVILIGTPYLFNPRYNNVPELMRLCGERGFMFMEAIQYEDPEWNTFLKRIWKYQFTNTKTVLTTELSHAIYEKSGGIIGEAVALYYQVQNEAIMEGSFTDDKITVELINKVAEKNMFFGRQDKIPSINNKKTY